MLLSRSLRLRATRSSPVTKNSNDITSRKCISTAPSQIPKLAGVRSGISRFMAQTPVNLARLPTYPRADLGPKPLRVHYRRPCPGPLPGVLLCLLELPVRAWSTLGHSRKQPRAPLAIGESGTACCSLSLAEPGPFPTDTAGGCGEAKAFPRIHTLSVPSPCSELVTVPKLG